MSGTVKLLIGKRVGTNLEAGSMAFAIEQAMEAFVPRPLFEDPIGRQKLAMAIATGVIDHLVANAAAINVTIPDGLGGTIAGTTTIDKW